MNIDLVEYQVGEGGNILPALENENNYLVRFIFFNTPYPAAIPPEFEDMHDTKVSALHMDFSNDISYNSLRGKVNMTFYKKKDNRFVPEFTIDGNPGYIVSVNNAAAYGAIFTNSWDLYLCNILKGLKRLSLVADVYYKRTEMMFPKLTPACQQFYSGQFFQEFIAELSKSVYEINIAAVYSTSESLAKLNDAAVLNSCPALY
jgi:hypothetical protein